MSELVRNSRRDLLKLAGALTLTANLPMRQAAAAAAAQKGAPAVATPKGLQVRKLSWAGVLVETDNTSLYIDVVDVDEKKGEKPDVLLASHKANAVITHPHGDHFDKVLLNKLLGNTGRLICQRAALDFVDQRVLRVQPVDMWQPVFFPLDSDDLVAFPIPAVDGWGTPQVSWVIDGGGVRIFHGGDSQFHADLVNIGRAYGPFDVAFLPINGASQNSGRFVYQGIPGVMTPSQAVAAAQLLHAKVIVPIHFGGSDPPTYIEVADPLGDLQRTAKAANIPVRVLGTGESFRVEREPGR
jgi:L-ascorbate metabolism protein UlaG (beta-lactamase superfamily)